MKIIRQKKKMMKEILKKNRTLIFFNILIFIVASLLFTGCWRQEEKLFREAYYLWKNKDYETAIITYLKIIDNNPRSKYAPFAQFQIGNIYNYNLKRYQEAVIAYQKTISYYPKSEYAFPAQFEIAEIYSKRFKEKRQAIIEYERLLKFKERKDEFPGIRLKIIDCYIELGDYDKALFQINTIRKENPDYKNMDYILFKEGLIFYQKNDFSNSREVFEKFMKLYPESVFYLKAMFWYAQTLEDLKLFEEALTYYNELKEKGYKEEVINGKIERVENSIKEEKNKVKRNR